MASSYRLLDAANSNTFEGFLQHGATAPEKLNSRGGFQAAFPLYHMNRHKQQTRRKNQTEANLKKEMKGSYQMKKMKKACAVLLAVLSVSLLASAFAGEDNVVRWDRIVGVITALNVDNPVGNISSGTFPWTTRGGTARVDLSTGAVAWEVDGSHINGAVFSGTPGPITAVKGTLVCNAGAGNQRVFDTGARSLSVHGDAQFSGQLSGVPTTGCGNPIFLIRIAQPAGAAGRWIATGANPSILDQ
jgi:hypothetical protein